LFDDESGISGKVPGIGIGNFAILELKKMGFEI
jgi:hypothetical protein